MLRTRPWVPYLYVAPAVALLGLVFAYPIVKRGRLLDAADPRAPAGPASALYNYRLVLEDPTFLEALKHSALLLLAVPCARAISIVFSVLLYERRARLEGLPQRAVPPFILAVPVVGIVASYIFQLNGVAQHDAARRSGSTRLALDWLGSERLCAADRRCS